MTEAERKAWEAGRDAAAAWHDKREADEIAISRKYRSGSNSWFAHCMRARSHSEYASDIRRLTSPEETRHD